MRSAMSAVAGVVGHEHDAGAVAPGELGDQRSHRLSAVVVELAGRLVGQQQRGAVGQRRAQGDPLALAARQLGGQRLGAIGQAGRPSSSATRSRRLPDPTPPQGQRQRDRTCGAQVGRQRGIRVLAQEPDPLVA